MRSGVCLLLFFFLVVTFFLGDCNKNRQLNFVSCLQRDKVHPWHKFYIAGTESTIEESLESKVAYLYLKQMLIVW